MKFATAIVLFCVSVATFAAPKSVEISALEWAMPRSGETLLSDQRLRQLISSYLEREGAGGLTVHYPGGDEGSLWASELKGWLVGLGIASDEITLSPGSGRADVIRLSVDGE